MKKFSWLFAALFLFITPHSFSKTLTFSDRYEIYNAIDFNGNPVNQQVFNYAFKGYLNLLYQNKIRKDRILSIIDYSLHSKEKRFWVFDLYNKQLLFNEWVSHGKYTGNAMASNFSNIVGSKQSSIGFFITGFTYDGKHDYSLKLYGVEPAFNSNAFKRGIVIHGADYVSKDFIQKHNRLGRSYGCPAIREEVKTSLITTIKDGSCLFSYYPSKTYLTDSKLLNNQSLSRLKSE